jgi:hypothetical protein
MDTVSLFSNNLVSGLLYVSLFQTQLLMEKQERNYGPLPLLETELFINDVPIRVSHKVCNKFNTRVGGKKGPKNGHSQYLHNGN